MSDVNSGLENYAYGDFKRDDLLRMIPGDGSVIGSIGCGTGITEHDLVKAGREVHGVDVSAEAIALAAGRLTSARVIKPEERMPFGPDSLDGLILADVIEHIPQAWEYLAGVARAVRPGGWVVISVPNMRHVSVFLRFVLGGDWPERPYGIFDRTHLQVMTKRRLKRWCAGAGLRIERWFDRYFPARYYHGASIAADWMTLRLFHQWFMFQLQVVCRRVSGATPMGE
jgi:2-polyprenyl-3-methyl-5-hydroxy-6-metoxy-1,4-benzoquinol methylase